MPITDNHKYLNNRGLETLWGKISSLVESAVSTLVSLLPLSISNGGTGATTAPNAEYNLITKPRNTQLTADIQDNHRIPFLTSIPSTTNGVFAGYRLASQFWAYIKGKADSVYQPIITAGTGLSKTDNTINHSNSVTAQTSDLGSYQRIPVIRYDAQGHITKGDYVSIFNKERTSTIKVGYITNGSSGVGWFKVGEVTYWTGTYNRFSFIISVLGTNTNSHDYGLLRVRGVSAATIGYISGLTAQWIVKTPSNGSSFTSDCIRLVRDNTSTSSGATLSVYMKLPVANMSYNFMMLNEANAGTSIKAFQFEFSNSTTKESVEPASTYASTMAPLELGNQSNCLEITNDNWQSYMTASNESSSFSSCDILTIPEGITSIFFSTQQTAGIACIRGRETIGRFPRNGVRITIAGNWKPQENGGYAGGNAEGRFSTYLYTYRAGVAGGYKDSRMDDAFEDFLYFNGVWYSKGY